MAQSKTKPSDSQDGRQFIRHPSAIPIRCQKRGHLQEAFPKLRDISFGGMAFAADQSYFPGDVVEIAFPSLKVADSLTGEIVWSSWSAQEMGHPYLNGMKFLDEDTHFRARLIEQICHIEAYRQAQIQQHERNLTPEEAAEEWVTTNAGRFPS